MIRRFASEWYRARSFGRQVVNVRYPPAGFSQACQAAEIEPDARAAAMRSTCCRQERPDPAGSLDYRLCSAPATPAAADGSSDCRFMGVEGRCFAAGTRSLWSAMVASGAMPIYSGCPGYSAGGDASPLPCPRMGSAQRRRSVRRHPHYSPARGNCGTSVIRHVARSAKAVDQFAWCRILTLWLWPRRSAAESLMLTGAASSQRSRIITDRAAAPGHNWSRIDASLQPAAAAALTPQRRNPG